PTPPMELFSVGCKPNRAATARSITVRPHPVSKTKRRSSFFPDTRRETKMCPSSFRETPGNRTDVCPFKKETLAAPDSSAALTHVGESKVRYTAKCDRPFTPKQSSYGFSSSMALPDSKSLGTEM